MTVAHFTPNGFAIPVHENFRAMEKGDKVIDMLREDTRHRSFTAWDQHRMLIDKARQCFTVHFDGQQNTFKAWLAFQLDEGHTRFTYHHYQFLMDTIRFIRTGYRRVQPETIRDLLETKTAGSNRQVLLNLLAVKKELIALANTITPEESVDFLSMWLNQPRGLTDLMASLELMFGSHKQHMHLKTDGAVADFMA